MPRRIEVTDPAVHHGLSMYAQLERAAHVARRYPRLGAFVAEVSIPDSDTEIAIRRSGDDPTDSHYTIWGDPVVCLRYVTSIVSVSRLW